MKAVEKAKAIKLRKRGESVKEIASALNISQSTASIWVRNVVLSQHAQLRIAQRIVRARKKAATTLQSQRKKREETALKRARQTTQNIPLSIENHRIYCALVYWCEGAKIYDGKGNFGFTNSDPRLIKVFLKWLRAGFNIDRSKFRVLMQLHSYHDEATERKFWSGITGIPMHQFLNSHIKKSRASQKEKGIMDVSRLNIMI